MNSLAQPPRSVAAQLEPNSGARRATHIVAILAAAFTWPLLFVGGLVTTYRVGMAVPDWPKTFGINMFLYNFWNVSWGVFIEHGHRLYGTAVGLACIVLAFWFTFALGRLRSPVGAILAAVVVVGLTVSAMVVGGRSVDPFLATIVALAALSGAMAAWYALVERQLLPALGWLALAAVIGQGILGGYRVQLNSTDLAALHGCTGQAFFALMVALCVLTSRRWAEAGPTRPDQGATRWLALFTALAVYGQIVAGALLRHRSLGLELHVGLAVGVLGLIGFLSWRVWRQHREWPELVPSTRALAGLLVVQLALGVASWWVLRPFDGIARTVTSSQAVIRTAHQANGALLLGAAVVLALRATRHLGPEKRDRRESSGLSSRTELEVVA